MNKIGPTRGGTMLVEMGPSEFAFFEKMFAALRDMPRVESAEAAQPASLVATVPKRRAAKKQNRTRAPAAKTDIAKRTCPKCGNEFQPWRKDQKFCSACSGSPGARRRRATSSTKPPVAPRASRPRETDPAEEIREAARRAKQELGEG